MSNISKTSGNCSGDGGSGNGSCLDIGSNEDDVDFGMHTDIDSESEENTTNKEILYAINEEDYDDSDVDPVQTE